MCNKVEQSGELSEEMLSEKIAYHCSHHIRGPLATLQSLVQHLDLSSLTPENRDLVALMCATFERLQFGIDSLCSEVYMFRDSGKSKML